MIVVDSNIVAYLYLPGDHTAKAESLLQRDSDWAEIPLEFWHVRRCTFHLNIALDYENPR
jgi:predicted nucleic acid-binding protein